MRRILSFASLLLAFYGCNPPAKERAINAGFTLPKITNSQPHDSLKTPKKAEWMVPTDPIFVGKYKLGQKIDINPSKRDSIFYRDRVEHIGEYSRRDSVDIHGLDMVVDYENTIYYNPNWRMDETRDSSLYTYYPVYLVNSTNRYKIFTGKDGHAYGGQEAYNVGEWKPIEKRGFDMCGMGSWELLVRPKEYVVILMIKYQGDFRTRMRVRMEVGESSYVSKPFAGNVNPKQFREYKPELTQNKYK